MINRFKTEPFTQPTLLLTLDSAITALGPTLKIVETPGLSI